MKQILPHLTPLLLKNRLTELTYFTTNTCNMKCKHCFVMDELNSEIDPLLSVEEIIKMGQYIPNMQRVHLGGGEPFIRKDMPELVVALSQNWKTGVICIPTNGWYTENILKTIEAFGEKGYGTLRIHFSINSFVPEDMDNFTQVKNSFKNWCKSVEEAKKISAKYENITLVALTTYNEYNQQYFIKLIDFLLDDIEVDDFSFQLVREHGEYRPELDVDGFDKAIEYFFKHRSKDNALLKAFRSLIREETSKYYKNPQYITPCMAGTTRVVMSPSGDIYPCEKLGYPNLERDKYLMGSIRDFDYDITKLLANQDSTTIRDNIYSNRCHCDHGIDASLSQLSNIKFQLKLATRTVKNFVSIK